MLRYLFPTYCTLCHTRVYTNNILCTLCYRTLPFHKELIFRRAEFQGQAIFNYDAAIKSMILHLKFCQKLIYARFLGEELARSMQIFYGNKLPKLIIPVPLHKKRLQERGFNQVLEISKYISKKLNIPIEKQALIRHKNTKPQATCNASKRSQNIKNAFKLKKIIAAKHIILLDDVITTGGTIAESLKVFNKQNIGKVDIWCATKSDLK